MNNFVCVLVNRFPVFLFAFLLFCASCSSGRNPAEVDYLTVTRVVDGDTFWGTDKELRTVKVRLLGIDAPESRRSAHKEVGYYGKESEEYLKSMLSGMKVRVEYDVERYDQYGRTLAYVYLDDGTFVNADLVKKGCARVMTFPPNVKHANEFVKLQRMARRKKAGMWE
ncbi:MAG: thermonuclease family protein [Bacteroidales bacterium]|nr:thermonuclease family protein [Bacteroidales bacterium]